jgi:hypothetical protein
LRSIQTGVPVADFKCLFKEDVTAINSGACGSSLLSHSGDLRIDSGG